MEWLRALFGIVAMLACGASLLSLLPRGMRAPDRWLDLALCVPLGTLAVTVAYAVFDLVGAPLHVLPMTAAWVLLATAARTLRRTRSVESAAAPSPAPTEARWLTVLFLALLAANDAGMLATTLSRPVTGTDPMGIWSARAVLIHERQDLDSRELKRATFYPPLVPCSLAWVMDAVGARDFVRIKIVNPLMMLALQIFLLRSLRGRAPAWMTAFAALLLSSSPVFQGCVREPFADLPFMAFLTIGTVMLLDVARGDARALALVLITALAAALSRTEGIPAAPGMLLLAAWAWPHRRHALAIVAGGTALVAAGVAFAVSRFKGYEPFGAPEGFASDSRAAGERMRENSTYILGYFADRMLRFDRFGFGFALPLAALALRVRAIVRDRAVQLVVIVTLWIFFVHYASYIFYPGDVRQHLPLSSDRVPFRFTFPLVIAALLAVGSQPSDEVTASRTARDGDSDRT